MTLMAKFGVNLLSKAARSFHGGSNLSRRAGIIFPNQVSWMWRYSKEYNDEEYTVDALKRIRTGGRGPDGRIMYKHVSGGLNYPQYMVDYNRSRQLGTGQNHDEIILKVTKTFFRHPFLALVASGNTKRWIVATSTMKPGDIISSHATIPRIPVEPKEGDAYPIGALPPGTRICLVELVPGEGAVICRTAGTSAIIVRRGNLVGSTEATTKADVKPELGRHKIPSSEEVVVIHEVNRRQEYKLLPQCVAVVGQVSNVDFKDQKFASFQEKKMTGRKQRSGHYQKKTGRFGRKIKGQEALLDETVEPEPLPQLMLKFTRPGLDPVTQQAEEAVFSEMHTMIRRKIQPPPKEFNAASEHTQPTYTYCGWSKIR